MTDSRDPRMNEMDAASTAREEIRELQHASAASFFATEAATDAVKPLTRDELSLIEGDILNAADEYAKLGSPMTALAFSLRALLATAKAGLADTERLEWLNGRAFTAYQSREPEHFALDHCVVVDEEAPRRLGCVNLSLRAAIDEARENETVRTRSGQAAKDE